MSNAFLEYDICMFFGKDVAKKDGRTLRVGCILFFASDIYFLASVDPTFSFGTAIPAAT